MPGFLAADQVAAHRHQAADALRPQRGDDVGGSRSPVETGEDGRLDPEGVHQGDGVDRERYLLPITERRLRQKARHPATPQVGNDHPVPHRGQPGRHLLVAMNVVRPAVQQEDRWAISRTGVDVPDVEDTGLDLPDRAQRGDG